jgi:hypothetical protein
MPQEFSGDKQLPFKTVGQLIEAGTKLPVLEALKWEKGQGARQTAYLCYSSGTSGLPVCESNSLSDFKRLMCLSISITEGSHDQPSQCHFQRFTDRAL